MFNLIRCEMIKLSKSLPLKIMFLLMAALSIVSSISSFNYVGSEHAEELEIALTGFDAFFSSLRDMPTITVIGILIVGILICNDFENRTIQTEIAAGHSRTAIMFSKILAFGIAYCLVFLPYPLGRAVFQGIFIQFGTSITADVIFKMLVVFLTIILNAMAINGLTLFLAFIVRKPMIVMGGSCVLIVLGGNALMSIGAANYEIGRLLEKTPLGAFKELALCGYASINLLQSAFVSVLCIIAVIAVTHIFFRKAELK